MRCRRGSGDMNRWTLHVRDFGKIKKADVEVAPLTLFVGDNNSGKSYLMTLIYGLLHVQFFFEEFQLDESFGAYGKCCKILDSMFSNEKGIYTFSADEKMLFQQLLNETLERNRQKFLTALFNRETKIGSLWVEFSENGIYQFNIIDDGAQTLFTGIWGLKEDGRSQSGYGVRTGELEKRDNYRFFLSYIMEFMIRKEIEETVYFPTARTGYLLTYKTIAGNAMQDRFNLKAGVKNLLTRPNSDFLSALSSMTIKEEQEAYRSIIRFIEKHIISGKISMSNTPTQDILYIPEGENMQLPMFVASGVVTEVTPLLLFLQYGKMGALMMEEPEISLHPQLQWEMARALIRLTNAGMPVFITTHSDIILQHVNNMIRMERMRDRLSDMKDPEYEEADLLKKQNVAVYQFDVTKEQKTEVSRLECGDYGFEAMTFYHTLEKLNNQIDQLENMEE